MVFSDPSIPLAGLLRELPPGLVRALGAPADESRPVRAIALADPKHPAAPLGAGSLVLAVAVTGRAATALLEAAARDDAAAVVLRFASPAAGRRLSGVAAAAGVPLLELGSAVSWTELQSLLADRLAAAGPPAGGDELVELAETTALLTRGLVTIEDMRARVLAYSQSGEEVDELRRLSILGRMGPAAYLAMLREWGVYERLGRSGEVVEVDEHPESGIRRRLAVGVFAGTEQLGTIWVQQGPGEFPKHARDALLGASRVAGRIMAGDNAARAVLAEQDELAALLNGTGTTLGALGRKAALRPCLVVAFCLGDGSGDPASRRRSLREASRIMALHAAAFRPAAAGVELGGRGYVLLPDLADVTVAEAPARAAIEAVRRNVDSAARVALGPAAGTLAQAAVSRRGADLALEASGQVLVRFDLVRPSIVAGLARDALAARAELLDPRVRRLVADDPVAADTLRHYLDLGCDAGAVAERMRVHTTTVRYRLRKAFAVLAFDPAERDARFALALQLRAIRR